MREHDEGDDERDESGETVGEQVQRDVRSTGREAAEGVDVGGARRGDPLDETEHGDDGGHPDRDARGEDSLAPGEQAGQGPRERGAGR